MEQKRGELVVVLAQRAEGVEFVDAEFRLTEPSSSAVP
jgi:hypothetical protein